MYVIKYDVRPRPNNPDYGKVMSREVTIIVNESTSVAAEAAARSLLDRIECDVESQDEASWLDIDIYAAGTPGRAIVERAQAEGIALILGPRFPP